MLPRISDIPGGSGLATNYHICHRLTIIPCRNIERSSPSTSWTHLWDHSTDGDLALSGRGVPGNEEAGFSEALVGVDGEWRGIRVEAMAKEKQVIDFDPSTGRSTLPGAGETAIEEDTERFREQLEKQSTNGDGSQSDAVPPKPDGGLLECEDNA